ncbi:hypothetical protein [Pseudoalteromonas sp. XMcav11-Q]|uniref:hypothetical protein n=1 Tax=Pseudoalteromonas sp. XMcav11-Q TaxID=3136665 RepID=UPI0032C4A816
MSRPVERLYVTTRSSDFTSRPVAATLCRDLLLYVTTRSNDFTLRLVATASRYDP